MKIKSIYIDGLHNASKKTYNFGDINYIYGNNGIGKSTILQAIQYALLGYIPGTAKNSKEALLRHSPKGYIEVKICLTDPSSSSDILVTRKVTSAVSKVETIPGNIQISDIVQDIEIPIFNFNEFVSQTANKLKDYFIKNILPTAEGDLDWKTILTEAILEHNFNDRNAIVNYGLDLLSNMQDGSALDQVVAANVKFKEEQSFNKSELQRLQNTIDSLIYYDDYVGPKDLTALNVMILTANSLRDQLIRYESSINATQSANDELSHLKLELETLESNQSYDDILISLSELKQKYNELSSSIATRTAALTSLRASDADASYIVQSKGVCPYTKVECSSIISKIDEIRKESEKKKAHGAELSAEIDKMNGELNQINSSICKCETILSDFNNIRNRIATLEKTMYELPQKPNTDKTLFELDAELATLSDNKEKLQANIQYNSTIESLTKLKYDAELKDKALTAWVKKTDTNGLQTTLMEESFNKLAETLTNLIREMYGDDSLQAHFNILTKANSFSFGIIRNNIYIPYDLLSSGEKCLYTLALMICITNTDKSPLKVLLCDDMFDHLDNQVIENTFDTLKIYNTLSNNHIQFIFAGVKECKNAADIVLTV